MSEWIKHHPEAEPFPRWPILLSGAGSGLGAELARKFAKEGYQIIAGMRSKEHLKVLCRSIREVGGRVPQSFLVDVTDHSQVLRAYNQLRLLPHTKLHFMSLAAGGLEAVKMGVAREIVNLKKAAKTVSQATEAIKTLATSSEVMQAALAINYEAPLRILELLEEGGHLGPESVVLTTSSSISNSCDPDHPENYPGPWFYYSVGMSKERGVRTLRERARELGISHVDIVAPEISDTAVGEFMDDLVKVLQVQSLGEIEVPRISKKSLVEAIFRELTREDPGLPKIRTVFVESNGVSYQRPSSWEKPFLPYL